MELAKIRDSADHKTVEFLGEVDERSHEGLSEEAQKLVVYSSIVSSFGFLQELDTDRIELLPDDKLLVVHEQIL